ncbi:Hpt sensor hybrid histidine kinase [Cupriavidus sp. YR651]|uniref:ATP-binding protein n=1 Tax=Cupriavidus sp. YR651 TaxID=1855315 RepID=UPI0008904C74|nr:ATP-binding protein [Cupriavidus sp. YR651]SDC84406.1 Hpt sensor hybrid histidine kinase [Cupriavidus sp. YR651]
MQQILDRTQESLTQAFASLARNARRQQQLYYATVGLLVAIVIVSMLLLAGLAAAMDLDNRRSHVAEYVRAISQRLQGEAAFLRRTALTVRQHENDIGDSPPDATLLDLLDQIRLTGTAVAPDGRYTLLVPPSTRRAWGHATPHRVWRLQQIATAALTTRQALKLDQLAYVVDPNADYAIVLSPSPATHSNTATLDPGIVPTLRDNLARRLQERSGTALRPKDELIWTGPAVDPVLGAHVMTSVMAVHTEWRLAMLLATSIPVESFLSDLMRPSDASTLLLVNSAGHAIDVSPVAPSTQVGKLLDRARHMPPERFGFTRSGLLRVQPLGQGFGSLVYFLSFGTLLGSLVNELSVIGAIGLILVAGIVLMARYWDVHLLRRSHAEAARTLEKETINHILVSATPIGLCILRLQDGAIQTANQLAESLLGPETRTTLPPHIVDALRQQSPRAMRGQLPSIAQIIVPRRPGPAPDPTAPVATGPADAPDRQFLQLTCAPVRYRNQDVLFCAIQDVTAQQQLEQQLRTAQQTSEAMMRARSNFFASMSHEIRTPLNALLGNLELLARANGLQAHAARLRALNVASDGLRRIVNDILDFSKIDAGEMKLVNEPFRVIDDFESLACSYAPMVADRPLRFYAHLAPSLDAVLTGDRTRLVQIVNNLLTNAFKFTASGKVTLKAEIATDSGARRLLICSVRDSGIGMSAALAARVFHPFVQGEAGAAGRYAGTGLGLCICARLSELMGGHISVESVEGVGSAFTVVVPLGAPVEGTEPLARPAPVARESSAMVLCQEVESGATLQAWLQSAGWHATSFYATNAALAALRSNPPHLLVVTDEYDPGTLDTLRAVCPVPVVWVTSDGPDRPVRRAANVYAVAAYSRNALFAATAAALHDREEDAHASPEGNEHRDARPVPGIAGGPDARTVLVAEDSPLNQMLIAEQLELLGWHPIVVGDGRQALAVLAHNHVDLILTDIHMPMMDGYALLAAVQTSWPDIAVLAFSAVTVDGRATDWQARGFAGHIAKPASLRELELALRAAPVPPRTGTAAATAGHADVEDAPLAPAELARYQGILRQQLQTDAPELAAIMRRHDTVALRHWAHRSAGAFLIVQAREIFERCRNLEHRCAGTDIWTPEVGTLAEALYAAVLAYGKDATSPSNPGTGAFAGNPGRPQPVLALKPQVRGAHSAPPEREVRGDVAPD